MVRPAVVAPTPTPEPKKPPQGTLPLEDRLSQIQTEGETPQKPAQPQGGLAQKAGGIVVSPEKVNIENAAFLAFQKALSQAAQRGYIDESEVVRVIKDKDIWNDLWLRYQVMTGYPKIGEKGYNPAKPEEVFTTALLEKGITYYTNAYVVQAVRVMPSQGIDPKNWSASLQKGIDAIREWRYTEELEEGPEQAARNASLGYATAQQAPDKDKQAYLELLSTLNRQGYVDVYNALDQDFPAIYARWKALESDFPGLTRNDFSTYLNRYIAPAVGEVDPTQSATEFLKGMRRNLENLERLDTGRPLIPEEGYRVDEETGEVVPVYPTPKGGWPEPGPTISEQTEAEEAELRRRGYVPFTDEQGTRWLPAPDAQDYITGAGGGTAMREAERIAGANRAIINRANEQAAFAAARRQNEAAARKYVQEERIAARVAPYTGTVPPETSAREAFNVGRRNLGLLEALSGGGSAAYERELEAERVKNVGQRPPSEPQPAPGYETRVGSQFGGGLNPVEISQRMQAAREPWTARRMAEPLAAQFPKEWEEYSQPRIYGWEKGGAHVGAGQFTAEEPFDMGFKDFLQRRAEISALSPPWAKAPKEGEYRAPITNWGFKQPWEGGPAPRGFSQPRPTAGPARMTPIRIGARR